MGMYIEIAGDYPCAKCGTPLKGWQSKELRYHGYPVEPLLQTLALVPGMDGEIHNSHAGCDHFTEYAVIDGILGDATDRRTTRNDPLPISHTIPTDAPLARTLAEAKGKPVVVEANGVRYRVMPENPWAFYPPTKRGIGIVERLAAPNTADALPVSTADAAFARVVAGAKPAKKSLEWGPETRYGREDDYNQGYNDALDAYERALMAHLARDEAGEEE